MDLWYNINSKYYIHSEVQTNHDLYKLQNIPYILFNYIAHKRKVCIAYILLIIMKLFTGDLRL